MASVFPEVDDINTYGGPKTDEGPIESPTTQLSGPDYTKLAASTAAMTHTGIRAWVRFVTAATTGAMTLTSHDAGWGNSAPVTPLLARTGTGVFTVTWPTSVNDELSLPHTVNARAVLAPVVEGSTAANTARVAITAPNVLTVYTFASGVAADIVGSTIGVQFL